MEVDNSENNCLHKSAGNTLKLKHESLFAEGSV